MSFTYKIVPNFLTKEECDLILKFTLENLKLETSEIIDQNKNIVNNIRRKSKVVFYPYYTKFSFLLEKITLLLNENITIKGYDLDYINSHFQFTEYKDGDHFVWHRDIYSDIITERDRYCSLVIQLNDEYENGDLQIETNKNEILTIEKKTGNLVIFLSNMNHRVTQITSGNRYTLVNWVGLKKQNNYTKTLL